MITNFIFWVIEAQNLNTQHIVNIFNLIYSIIFYWTFYYDIKNFVQSLNHGNM